VLSGGARNVRPLVVVAPERIRGRCQVTVLVALVQRRDEGVVRSGLERSARLDHDCRRYAGRHVGVCG
jgi:hypothetical protein